MQQSFTSLYMFMFPFCLAVFGFLTAFNICRVADLIYLRCERLFSSIFGGMGPRGMRVVGSVMLFFGTMGFTVEGADIVGLI